MEKRADCLGKRDGDGRERFMDSGSMNCATQCLIAAAAAAAMEFHEEAAVGL